MKAGVTILVVEDDRDVRDSLIEVLEDEGYEAIPAANGSEALALLRASGRAGTDLILLDLMMPEMDGWQFRREQLKDERIADIPVIVLTADGTAKRSAETMSAAGGLDKPISIEELLDVAVRYRPPPD